MSDDVRHEADRRRFELARSQPIDAAAIAALEEIVEACRSGRVSAYAIVVKEDGYSRWTSWKATRRQDSYNLVGQLTVLAADIASSLNKE